MFPPTVENVAESNADGVCLTRALSILRTSFKSCSFANLSPTRDFSSLATISKPPPHTQVAIDESSGSDFFASSLRLMSAKSNAYSRHLSRTLSVGSGTLNLPPPNTSTAARNIALPSLQVMTPTRQTLTSRTTGRALTSLGRLILYRGQEG